MTVSAYREWKTTDVKQLIEMWNAGVKVNIIAKRLDRTMNAVRGQARYQNLPRQPNAVGRNQYTPKDLHKLSREIKITATRLRDLKQRRETLKQESTPRSA